MQPRAILVLAVPTLTLVLPAQVQAGDVGVTGFSTTSFGIATPASPTTTAYATTGFQGTGPATSQSILHVPFLGNEFVVGGFGFVGRALVTGPGTVTWTLVTNGVGEAAQLSWDNALNVIVADAGTDQVRSVALWGNVTDLSSGPQPWGTTLNAGAWDPRTGDVIVGNQGGLYRLANGTSTGVTIATGLGGDVSAVGFDRANGDILATVLPANRIVRVDATATVTDFAPPGTVVSPNALDVDANGDLIVGGSPGAIYRVPPGGPATLIATNGSPAATVSGLSIARFDNYAGVMGQACNGAGGLARLTSLGPWQPGAPFSTSSIDHAPGAIGVAIFGLSDTVWQSVPLPLLLDPLLGTASCYLNVAPDLTIAAFTDASGVLTVGLTATAAFDGHRLYAQHVVLENVPGGFSFSNGVWLQY